MQWLSRLVWGCLLSGCFRQAVELPATWDEADVPSALTVTDESGTPWSLSQIPRRPVFTLTFSQGLVTPASELPLTLIRGDVDEGTLTDLDSSTLRASTRERMISLAQSVREDRIEARPIEPLAAGEEVSLVWRGKSGPRTFGARVSQSPTAGASLVASLPADASTGVPPNLARAILRFDGYIEGDPASAVSLLDAGGQQVAIETSILACEALHLEAGDCISVRPLSPLATASRYTLRANPLLRDATGSALDSTDIVFSTARANTQAAPSLAAPDCLPDELSLGFACALRSDQEITLRARCEEQALLTLVLPPRAQAVLGGPGAELRVRAPLEASTAGYVLLEDLAGNQLRRDLVVAPDRDLPKLSIDEVRADPLGPEPAQEYVELLNYGEEPIDLMGMRLSSTAQGAGRAIATSTRVEPGERVLVVSPSFDADDDTDGPRPPGVKLARLSGALSLRNEGTALWLRDTSGRRLSAAPALSSGGAGGCISRVGERFRDGDPNDFRPNLDGACTPGSATLFSLP